MKNFLKEKMFKRTLLGMALVIVAIGGVFVYQANAAITNITVTAPNGGEVWSGHQDITWTEVGDVSTVDIVYTTNNWQTSTLITEGIAAGTRTFDWDTSSVANGSNYLIKVYRSDNVNVYDTSNAVFEVDNVKPTVESATAVPNPAKDEEVTVTVVFSETMDTTVPPVVTLTGLAGDDYTVTQSTYTGDTWVGTVTLTDGNEDATGNIKVTTAQDLAANVMSDNATAGTIDVDTLNPALNTIVWADADTSTAISGTDTLTVTFSEAMDTATLTTADPVALATELGLSAGIFGATGFTATWNTPTNTILTITLGTETTIVSGATLNPTDGVTDVIGNADATADPVAITDNVKPTVTSATVGSDPAGPGVATITVVFSELMDTATPPTIRITGLATNPYTVTQSSYTANTWVGTFTVLDNNEAATATITVSGAKDVATNTMLADNTAGTFGVDTIAPVISNVNVDKTAYQATLDPIVVVTIVENNTADTVKVNGFDATETAIPGTWTYSLTHGGVIGRYSLSIDAADITGNTIQQFATSYDVVADGAPAAPVIAITNPTAGATLLATTTLTFTTNSGATTNAQVSIDGGAYTAATTNANPGTYVLDTTSLANGSHTLRVKDTVSGLTGYSDYVTFLVSNASDTTSPLFVSQVPAASSTNVSITPDDLYVSFNEALDPTTIGSTTVMLCLVDDPTCATPVNIGSPMLMENQKMIRLGGPNLILDNATSYWIKVTTGIADLAGNHLLADYGSPTTSQFTTESAPTGALAVDNISQIRYWGVANGGYDNGWEWVMSATIPTNANHFHLKFADWTSGGNTLPVAGNMKYWSEEITSGLRGSASNPVFITAANTYPDDIILDTDNNTSPNAPGMQTKIHIQVQIPSGQAGGSYSTSYGLEN